MWIFSLILIAFSIAVTGFCVTFFSNKKQSRREIAGIVTGAIGVLGLYMLACPLEHKLAVQEWFFSLSHGEKGALALGLLVPFFGGCALAWYCDRALWPGEAVGILLICFSLVGIYHLLVPLETQRQIQNFVHSLDMPSTTPPNNPEDYVEWRGDMLVPTQPAPRGYHIGVIDDGRPGFDNGFVLEKPVKIRGSNIEVFFGVEENVAGADERKPGKSIKLGKP